MKQFFTLTPEEACKELKTDFNGLSSTEAQARLARDGKNALAEGKKKSLLSKFMDQMKDVMIIVLLVAALITAVLCVVENLTNPVGEADDWMDLADSGIILLIVIINAVIGVVQENKAENSMDALKSLNKPFAKVLRDGKIEKIKSEDIVVGDIVVLEAGDIIPADMRLFKCASLKIEEAALTGESVPSEKSDAPIENPEAPLGDRCCMAYSSGVVSYGRGMGIVTATGMNTEVGKIAKMLQEDDKVETPLQVQIAKTAKVLSVAILAIAVVIFAVILLGGFFGANPVDTSSATGILDMVMSAFMVAVAIAVAAIPEGLPAVVTIVLALGVQKMSERKAIVRNLPSVESLGCCEVICSDKTGTLTLNQMTVKELYTPDLGLFSAEEKVESKAAALLVRGMVLCNDTKRAEEKLVGDPTETALVAYADKYYAKDAFDAYERLDEKPFDSVRKLMSTYNKVEDEFASHTKGAPDILIGKCRYIYDNGTVRELTAQDVANIKASNSAMAVKALRVLGVAVKSVDANTFANAEEDMIFVGLVGMIDPPRAEVKDAVATCKQAGMRAVMITGDHADTAAAIAREIGILEDGMEVITGADLDKLSDEEFKKRIDNIGVYARVSPENKVRIVKTFREKGKKVAMTGDGVNDAPSIKAADIGVGMGITGTDVSKGASDMVLADDNFATIVNAVEEGRKIFANIKKSIQYLLSANIAEVLCLFIVTLVGILTGKAYQEEFLGAVMILWVNLVTDSLPALALGMEEAEGDIMKYPPRKEEKSLFSGKTGVDIVIQGIIQTGLVLTSFFVGDVLCKGNLAQARTMAFITLCLIQLFHAYNVRSTSHSLFASNPFGNKMMNISFVACSALLLFAVLVPKVNEFFGATSLSWTEWFVALGCAILVIPFVELQKFVEGKIMRKMGKEYSAQ